MATYTIRLGDLVKSGYSIWDTENPFPIFNEAYRPTLQQMIIDHYYMQEIGTETPMDFKRMLNQRLREIMPKYNAMYISKIDWDSDPLVTYHSHTDDTGKYGDNFTEGTRENKKGNQTDIHLGFDTPMNIAQVDTDSPNHMSDADRNVYGTRTDTTGHAPNQKDVTSGNHDNDIDITVNGISIYDKIQQYRDMTFNIDRMIINELADLFMMVF